MRRLRCGVRECCAALRANTLCMHVHTNGRERMQDRERVMHISIIRISLIYIAQRVWETDARVSTRYAFMDSGENCRLCRIVVLHDTCVVLWSIFFLHLITFR